MCEWGLDLTIEVDLLGSVAQQDNSRGGSALNVSDGSH